MPVDFDKIKQLREAAGLTQAAAAARAAELGGKGFAGQYGKMRWHDVEAGRFADPRISTVEAIAAVLGVGVQDLLSSRLEVNRVEHPTGARPRRSRQKNA